jgi:chemotaxis protein methyltransferase CheR
MGSVLERTQRNVASALHSGFGPPLSDRNFERLSEFVHDYCGIRITSKKRTMVDGRLRRRMRVLDIADINDYCDFLFEGNADAKEELVNFIDAITTNKTDFFREPSHFIFLQSQILPGLVENGRRRIKIWSAASSTGAEAYTIAMIMDDFCLHNRGIDYGILATDISTEVLDKGLRGRYPDTMLEPVPEDFRRRYVMLPADAKAREFRIVPHLRAKVAFFQLNLMDERYPFDTDYDLIFCRNILIYFDRATQGEVLRRLCGHIRPGGYLFLGHSETVAGHDLPLQTVANTIFQRD